VNSCIYDAVCYSYVINLFSVSDANAGAVSSVSHACPHHPSTGHSYSTCDLRCSHVDNRYDASSMVCIFIDRWCRL